MTPRLRHLSVRMRRSVVAIQIAQLLSVGAACSRAPESASHVRAAIGDAQPPRGSGPEARVASIQPTGSVLQSGAPSLTATSLARFLPDLSAPFRCGSVILGSGWARREYAWGGSRAVVTIGQQVISFERWVASSADYPQILLGIEPDRANGFYDCSDASGACDAHIHLRSGIHVEVMGGGTTSRVALDALLAKLPLSELASEVPALGGPGVE